MSRDHGGNLDAARARFGGEGWIDLSTGINRRPWPVPDLLPRGAWTDLPTASAKAALMAAAANAFGTAAPGLALNGAQAAIQLLPLLRPPGLARVVAPTYNEHAACLCAAGWRVEEVASLDALAGADLGVVVNPNNPDGRRHDPAALRALSRAVPLLVDESFCDADPALSVAADADERLIVLRSFGKFWGLAGLRLGFVFADAGTVARLEALAGPWPVGGPALEIGRLALADADWARATAARLRAEALRLDALAAGAGWALVGGTALFRSYAAPDAAAAQERLARHRIWSRIFPWSPDWLRLGLPGSPAEWDRLAAALHRDADMSGDDGDRLSGLCPAPGAADGPRGRAGGPAGGA